MTVEQLIEKLKEFPPYHIVYTATNTPATSVDEVPNHRDVPVVRIR